MNENYFSLPLLNEPFPYVTELVDALLPYAEAKRYPKGIRLSFREDGKQLCHLIVSGSVEVHRNSDSLLILTIKTPGIVGLAIHDAYLVTSEVSRIATLTLDKAHGIFNEKGMWELVSRHLMVITNKLYSYSRQLSAPTVYEILCNQLIELMSEQESLRNSIAVERYIREKTHISRSSIMKILADLKTGGYIVIENGRLIEIRHLPSKY